jgi:prepilin-type N-terminal cleavage/methylation domain-containing protein
VNKQGFTLIELLVAASLFLAAVTGFSYLLKAGSDTVASANELEQAVYAIQSKMEEVRAYPFDKLVYLNNGTFADGRGRVTAVAAMVDLVRIDLELVWAENKNRLRLTTLRSKY